MLKENRPNFNLYPPNGYVSNLPGGPYEGTSWQDVVLKVTAYRRLSNVPVGDPQTEVYQEFCAQYPSYCGKALAQTANGPNQRVNKKKALAMGVMAWIADVYSAVSMKRVGIASSEEASRRREICASCPQQASPEVECASCGGGYVKLVADLRKIARTNGTGSGLMWCAALREETSISVGLRQTPRQDNGLPAFCWRRV